MRGETLRDWWMDPLVGRRVNLLLVDEAFGEGRCWSVGLWLWMRER